LSKIALNYSPLCGRHFGRTFRTGIYRYSYHLLKGLIANSTDSLSLVCEKEHFFNTYDLYHSFFQLFPVPPSIQKNKKTQSVVTIHDLIAWIYPELFSLNAQDLVMISKAQENTWIICPSESTKQDLISYFSIDKSRIFVTPLAACPKLFYPNSNRKILQKYNIPDAPYLFYTGRLEERKGIHLLLKAFKTLILEEKISDLNLVLSGPLVQRYPDLYFTFQNEIEKMDLSHRVIHIPFLLDEELSAFFSGALAFVYLSRYEGFGLPVLEAMQCGTPSLCFHNSSLPEVLGDAGVLLKDNKIESIAEALLNLYKHPQQVKTFSEKGLERARSFTWENTTQKTLEAYQSILK